MYWEEERLAGVRLRLLFEVSFRTDGGEGRNSCPFPGCLELVLELGPGDFGMNSSDLL